MFDYATGNEVINVIRILASDEIDQWIPPEKIAGEILLNAMADVIDDFKLKGVGELDFMVFYKWIGNIPTLLNEPWLTNSTRDTLSFAYEKAKEVELITSLRLKGLLPYG